MTIYLKEANQSTKKEVMISKVTSNTRKKLEQVVQFLQGNNTNKSKLIVFMKKISNRTGIKNAIKRTKIQTHRLLSCIHGLVLRCRSFHNV